MLLKKLISAALSLGMVTAMLVAPTVKAETVNVAQGKTVLNADGTVCTTMGALVDGNASTHTHDANLKEVIVDLGKRYKIDKISRDQQCGYQMVGIYVSNDINGEWKQLLRGNYQGNVLNVTNIDGAYRYVKLTAEGDWAHICTHELYVYAEETNGPALLDASQQSGVVTLDFNDTLADSTISGITVKDASGNPVSADMSLSTDKYSVTFNVPANKDWQVTIPSTVITESGTPFTATTINVAPKDVYAGLEHKTVSSFNIAKGAKLYNADGTECTTMGNLVDGNTSTNTHGANCKEVIVDLGRRCKIDKISRNQLCGYQLVGIYVSNDINGEWKQLKYGNFQGSVVEVENVDSLYRYVKLTASDHICTSELYVHTTMDVTEVSRNMTATASGVITADFSAQKAVNGTNSSHTDGWMGPYGKFSWWKLDFGENNPQNIGYVEIESRSASSDADGRRNFALYGANGEVTTDDTSADITGADKLASVGTTAFPAYSSSSPQTTKYQTATNDTQGYRYLIYKKTVAGPAEIGEFRAYVINPRVLSMTKDDNNVVTATFDSDIFAASIDGNITVKSGEEVVAISDVNVTDNIVTFTVVDPPKGDLTVTIDRFVRNLKSIPMAEDYTKVFVAPIVKVSSVTFDGTVAAGSTVKATAVLQSALSENKTVELIIVVKDSSSGKLKLVNLDRQTLTAGVPLTLEASVTLPADVTGLEVEAFVWESETLEPLTDKVNL